MALSVVKEIIINKLRNIVEHYNKYLNAHKELESNLENGVKIKVNLFRNVIVAVTTLFLIQR